MSGTGHLSELESLRLQVADLQRELAERDRDLDRNLQDQPEQAGLLRTIVEGTAADTGEEFFRSLVRHLAQALNVRYAFVGEWREQTSFRVRTLAVWSGTDFLEPFEYDPRNTPCATVIRRQYCLYASGVQSLFPEDHLLVQLEVDSYCGMPLFDKSGKPLGLLVIMDDRPMTRGPLIKDLLQIFGTRAAAELQRQQGDEALCESEAKFRALAEETTDWMWEVNEQAVYTYCSPKIRNLLGYEPDEALGKTPFDFMPEEEARRVAGLFGPIAAARKPFAGMENTNRHKDGRLVVLECRGVPIIDADGAFRGYRGFDQDITERKRAEEALQENHALLSAIMDTTMDIIFVKDLNGRYLHMNLAGARAVGIPAEEVVGKDDDAIWPADLAACCKAADQHIMTSNTAQTMEESTTAGGTCVTYLTTKAPYRNATGCMIGIIGVAHDITQIKRSEEALQRSHDFIRQIIDADPNLIFVKNRAGQFVLVNKAVADAYGTTVEHLFGKTDADFNANHEEVEFFRQKDLEVMDSLHERFIAEEVITDSTGKTRWLQTVKRPIFDDQGRAVMMLGTSTDITDRKQMEESLREREKDLRAAIEERERISLDLHDGILQSLFAVGLGLEASKSMMPPKGRRTAGLTLDQAINQLNRVMYEIRSFITGLGSDPLQGEDLATSLRKMLDSLRQNQTMRVRLAVEDRVAQALSAQQTLRLFLVIQEALSNCIQHGHAQEATVSLKMLKHGVRLSIRDNGRGFNQEAVAAGHGLGNMAARARKIGARFTVLSKVNEGTRIVFDLPNEASHGRH